MTKVTDDLHIIEKYPDINYRDRKYVDATPNTEYPLRILQAYLRDAESSRWSSSANGIVEDDPIIKYMNELCDKREKLLKDAIEVLSKELRCRGVIDSVNDGIDELFKVYNNGR